MKNRQYRKDFFKKISQTTEPTIPSESIANDKGAASILPPPNFQASSIYPAIYSGFNLSSVTIIDQICNVLNIAIHYSTLGKINFTILKNNNFSIDYSGLPSPDQRNLVGLSKKLYHLLINNGLKFQKPLEANQIHNIINNLINSQELNNLPSTNNNGIINQKLQGNLKTILTTLFNNLKSVN